jgi:hypothetical protein
LSAFTLMTADDRFGSVSKVRQLPGQVHLSINSGHAATASACRFRANTGKRIFKSSAKKSRPEAALNSNSMIVDQAAINAGFDFRSFSVATAALLVASRLTHTNRRPIKNPPGRRIGAGTSGSKKPVTSKFGPLVTIRHARAEAAAD